MGIRMVDFPAGWKRTKASERKNGHFKTTFGAARNAIIEELQLIGGPRKRSPATDVRIDCDGELRLDGLPRSTAREPEDPGVVAYWSHGGKKYAIACDRYRDRPQNMRAIAATLKAKRDETRWGCVTAEAAYRGYEALPPATDLTRTYGGDSRAPSVEHEPWVVLQVAENASRGVVDAAFRDLAKMMHPDMPTGSHDAFTRLKLARDAMHKRIAERGPLAA